MSLTGKEVAQMHKDYVMQSWARSGADTLPVERAEGIYFYDYDGTCDGIRDGGIQYFHGHGRSDRKSICTRVRRTVAYGACRICA